MFDEIVRKYEAFNDARILSFNYNNDGVSVTVEVVIRCMNKKNNYAFEDIKLTTKGVLLFRFIESTQICSTVINRALLKEEEGVVTIDFYPEILSKDDLRENMNSDFIIKSKTIEYRVK